MDREQLRALWDRNHDRPQFVREHRDAFAEHLSDTTAGHLPAPDASTYEYRQFLTHYKGVVTRQLAPEEGEGAENTTTDADKEEV